MAAHGRVLARAFAIGYHDGRTGITKTDNRPSPFARPITRTSAWGPWGGSLIATQAAGPGVLDFVFWGALQNGAWGTESDNAGAAALEGGYRLTQVRSMPWLRAGWWRASGDNNPSDNKNTTFNQLLPTPRVYARLPFYNLMNNTDSFVQLINDPSRKLELRSDLHWIDLTSGHDLWYLGGGAFDNKVFGFTGHPANGHTSFASVVDISSDWQTTPHLALNFYYGHGWGKRVISAIYPTGSNIQFGICPSSSGVGASLPVQGRVIEGGTPRRLTLPESPDKLSWVWRFCPSRVSSGPSRRVGPPGEEAKGFNPAQIFRARSS